MRESLSTADMLAHARAGYVRVDASEAVRQVRAGEAVLVDIRSEAQRREYGEVPSELDPVVVERNVLEWRFEPGGRSRLPQADSGRRVVLLCQQGYASSLAAESLLRLGVPGATDVIGGFDAWRAAGLPVA